MTTPADQPAGSSHRPRGIWRSGWWWWAAVVLVVGPLLLGVVLPAGWMILTADASARQAALDGLVPSGTDRRALTSGLLYACGIATLAVVLAWAPARTAAALGGIRQGLLLVPVLLPAYLVYAGWSLLRAPGTAIGDAVFTLAQRDGWGWLPLAVGRGCAIVGLACWSWPIVALVLFTALRARGRSIDDQLAGDGASRWRALWVSLTVLRWPLVLGWMLVFVVMLGSAIPLHVAQADTYTMRLWLRLDQSAPDQAAAIWLTGWPAWAPALLVAIVLAVRMGHRLRDDDAEPPRPPMVARTTRIVAACVWCISVLLPLALFLRELTKGGVNAGWRVMERFVRAAEPELSTALMLLAIYAVVGVVLVIASGMVASAARGGAGRGRRLAGMVMLGLAVVGVLVPGVLLGSAMAQASSRLGYWVSDGPWLTVLAAIVRGGIIPIGAGIALALSEPGSVVAVRRLDAGETLRGWLGSWVWPRTGAILAASMVFAVFAIHEIEAGVQVSSPMWPSLARKLLNMLHFARNDDLSAAVVLLNAPGLLIVLVGVLLWRPRPR